MSAVSLGQWIAISLGVVNLFLIAGGGLVYGTKMAVKVDATQQEVIELREDLTMKLSVIEASTKAIEKDVNTIRTDVIKNQVESASTKDDIKEIKDDLKSLEGKVDP